eukprot:SAG31_NODE_7230_length_1748_cov_21.537902_1_plen_380_part_10
MQRRWLRRLLLQRRRSASQITRPGVPNAAEQHARRARPRARMALCCAANARHPPAAAAPRKELGPAGAAALMGAAERALRDELGRLKPSALRKRARELGLDEERVDEAEDSDDPRAVLIDLLVSAALSREPAASEPAPDDVARSVLRSQLQELKISALRKRARELGCDEQKVDAAGDSDDPHTALIDLLVSASSTAEEQGPIERNERTVAALRQELLCLTLKQLKSCARELGVSEKALEDAEDNDEVHSAVAELCIEAKARGQGQEQKNMRLRAELAPLKLKALKMRARELGVSAEALDNADDADNVKHAVTELVVLARQPVQRRVEKSNEPHFGSLPAAPLANPKSMQPEKQHTAAPNASNKHTHVMLSYQWDHQAQVK